MADNSVYVSDLRRAVAEFIRERDWEQFHTPKDLAVSISIEAAELLEKFQWKTEDEVAVVVKDSEELGDIKDEVADIVIYSMSLANRLDFDLSEAILQKLEKNRKKYPVEKAKGKADKYTKLK